MPRLSLVPAHCCGKSRSVLTRSAASKQAMARFRLSPPSPVGHIGSAEIVLSRRPILREIALGPDPQRRREAGDRTLQIVAAVAGRQLHIGGAEIVLGPSPILREIALGPDPQRRLEAGDRARQIVSAVARSAGLHRRSAHRLSLPVLR
jgi:hypothetical protein